jgi:tRNA A37 threonylcarbamoyladenosine modification protein TsaB
VLWPSLDAGKGQIYVAPFAPAEGRVVVRRGEDWVLAPEAVAAEGSPLVAGDAPIVFGGSGAVRYRAVLEAALGARGRFVDVAGPSADAVAAHAIERFKRGDVEDLSKAVPAYGRAPDITKPKRSSPLT